VQLLINGGARNKTQFTNGEGILGIYEGWEYRLENMGVQEVNSTQLVAGVFWGLG